MQTITSDNIQHKWKMFVTSEKCRRKIPINLDNSIVKVQLTLKDISPFFCVQISFPQLDSCVSKLSLFEQFQSTE